MAGRLAARDLEGLAEPLACAELLQILLKDSERILKDIALQVVVLRASLPRVSLSLSLSLSLSISVSRSCSLSLSLSCQIAESCWLVVMQDSVLRGPLVKQS